MRKGSACVLAVVGAAGSAWGQVQTAEVKVHYQLTWQEARVGPSGTFRDGVLGNIAGGFPGQIDPGEAVLFTIKMTMRLPAGAEATAAGGGAGTPLHWAPSIVAGSSGTGTLSGFWDGDVNLVGTGTVQNSQWSDGTTNFATALRRKLISFTAGDAGSPSLDGTTVHDIRPGQTGADAEALNHANNNNVWQGLWIPTYAVYHAQWNLTAGSLGILSRVAARDDQYGNGVTMPIPLNAEADHGAPVSFLIIPAPGVTTLLAAPAIGWGARRRRR